jgi:hypothetical protein
LLLQPSLALVLADTKIRKKKLQRRLVGGNMDRDMLLDSIAAIFGFLTFVFIFFFVA